MTAERQHCDALIMNLVRWPERFDVIVASNLFGDLLTDLGGVIGGGLGLAPSTNTNPERQFPSMFEPVHGSAPGYRRPRHRQPDRRHPERRDDARSPAVSGGRRAQFGSAVERTLADGNQTPDLGGQLTTRQMGDAVIARLMK